MKKIFQSLHRSCGILAGVIIFISCLSGAILVFADEGRELASPGRYLRPRAEGRSPLPLSTIMEQVREQTSEAEVVQVQVYADTTRNYIFGYGGKSKVQIFVDPYSGKVVERYDRSQEGIGAWAMRLHRWLLDDSRSWGKQIMGASTLIFVLVLISGIVYWFPKSRKELQARLRIKTNANKKRFFADLHSSGGIYCVSLLLVMALTGLTWSYPWYRSGLYSLIGIKPAPKTDNNKPKRGKQEGSEKEVKSFDWDAAYKAVSQDYGTHRYITLEVGKAKVKPEYTWGNVRYEDSYKLDPETGAISSFSTFYEAEDETRVRGWIYSLHIGAWGGYFSKTLYFIVCLMGASFPLTGFWLMLRKRRRNKIAPSQG